jgi:hypothetical protein
MAFYNRTQSEQSFLNNLGLEQHMATKVWEGTDTSEMRPVP